jgi:hypothetical protein
VKPVRARITVAAGVEAVAVAAAVEVGAAEAVAVAAAVAAVVAEGVPGKQYPDKKEFNHA